MKNSFKKISFACSLLIVSAQPARSQGTFQNLNFESVVPPLNPDINFHVPITNALPGWTAYLSGIPRDWALYNNISLGGPSVSLLDSSSPFSNLAPLQGNYSVFLAAGAGVGQTARIPVGSITITFLLKPLSSINVSFAGNSIPLVEIGATSETAVMAGDISLFSGQIGELLFFGGGLFDNIQFSSQPIPEPSITALLFAGALALAARKPREN